MGTGGRDTEARTARRDYVTFMWCAQERECECPRGNGACEARRVVPYEWCGAPPGCVQVRVGAAGTRRARERVCGLSAGRVEYDQ